MAVLSSTSGVLVINAVGDSLRDTYNGSQFNIKSIVWSGTGLAADDLILEDNAGGNILSLKAGATEFNVQFEFPDRFFDDVEIDTIDNGTLHIFLR
jgi:hypothetical protein